MKDINDIKVLVFTVDCWNEKGANTMSSLFSWVKPENLANVYIRSDLPTYKGCNNYFQICESKVIKSIIRNGVKTGTVVSTDENHESNQELINEQNRYRKFKKHRPYSALLLRELLWKMGNWKTDELKDFLTGFKPDIIVYPYEGLIHFNRIVRFAVELTGAVAIGYFWDDNFTYKQLPYNIGYRIYRYFQRKDIRKSVALSSANFAITPKTKKEADELFGIDSIVLTKPITNTEKRDLACQKHTPIKMLYTGNLGIGRLDTIKVISKALDELNQDEKRFELDVYTGTYISDKEKRNIGEGVIFHQPIPQNDVIELQKQADILLFVEDINGKSSKIARLSFSTKLTDYFAAGKCILAVAAKDIAPMEYLSDNDAALVASDYQTVVSQLQRITQNVELVDEYAERAYNLGQQNHKSEIIISKLKNTIETVLLNEKM